MQMVTIKKVQFAGINGNRYWLSIIRTVETRKKIIKKYISLHKKINLNS